MKTQSVILALGLVLSAVPAAVALPSLDQSYLDTYRGQTGIPVPVSVVRPAVSLDYVGSEVELVFDVDERGRPNHITSRTSASSELVSKLTAAVSRWEFVPRRGENGEPVATKVLLPVRITQPKER